MAHWASRRLCSGQLAFALRRPVPRRHDVADAAAADAQAAELMARITPNLKAASILKPRLGQKKIERRIEAPKIVVQ